MFLWFSLFGLYLTAHTTPSSPKKTTLTIEVHNLKSQNGAVFIALFKPGESFPSGKPVEGKKLDIQGSSVQTTLSVDPGEYAVAVFHDENNNGKLDKNLFGIPKEPYGFSNNFRPKMSAPKFSDCQFTAGDGGKSIRIAVK
ncbi:DUF2141 domain-containing protein [Spirosoma panaciterrae]|uniref:DUF2141 domain-containing protein n=1 Tax=Spirosoma panaciterrae TaxID=496058 RepID=UPI00035E93AE|nr:DUF2141 domain-containing protein [Spirosoma panaciterrae]